MPNNKLGIFDRLGNKRFWIWNTEEHRKEDIITGGDCCFNHIIGLPKKEGLEQPIFDYEKLIFEHLQSHNHLWIKKATGLGITEFMLRFMAWLCLRDNARSGSQMRIVTGPRIDLAIRLIERMKRLWIRKEDDVYDKFDSNVDANAF